MRGWVRGALLGAGAWVMGVAVLGPTTWGENGAVFLLLFGSSVTTPMCLGLVDPQRSTPVTTGRWRVAGVAHLPAAVLLIAAFALPPGPVAGWLSVPWLLFTGLVAVLGVLRFVSRGGGPWGELARDAGLVFLVVGGIWTSASRFGVPFLGFTEPWVLLTGAHFHFAGLALPVIVGSVARRWPSPSATLASVGVVLGVPLVAIGITLRGPVEWVAVLWLVIACGFAVVGLLGAGREGSLGRRAGLLLSAVCLAVGMGLAMLYATAVWLATPGLTIPAMVGSHAVIQVFGFVLPALAVLLSLPAAPEPDGLEILLPWLGDRPTEGLWEGRDLGPGSAQGLEFHDDHEAELPAEPPGPPLPDGPAARAAERILSYEVFPPAILSGLVARTPLVPGDTVAARYRLWPGMDVVFAARVTDVFDDELGELHRRGFTYRTLSGHPVQGEETFEVEKDYESGRVRVRIYATSWQSTWLSRRLRPLIRRWQTRAGRAGVENLRLGASSE